MITRLTGADTFTLRYDGALRMLDVAGRGFYFNNRASQFSSFGRSANTWPS